MTTCSLRQAITAARADSTEPLIRLEAGLYVLGHPADTGTPDNNTGDLDWADQGPDVLGDLTIQGAGSGSTTIDATGLNDRIFDLDPSAYSSVSIQGVTLANGKASTTADGLFGGAIRSRMGSDGQVNIYDVVFDNNTAPSSNTGGGAILTADTLSIDNSYFFQNRTFGFGGAILNLGNAGFQVNLQITNSTFDQNVAQQNGGGAIANIGDGAGGLGDPLAFLIDSTLDGNKAIGFGGAIDTFAEATTNVVHSTLTRNLANADNTGGEAGGALQNGGGDVNVESSLIAGNQVGTGSTGPNCSGTIDSFGYNVTDGPGCPGLASTGDLIAADAVVGGLSNNGGLTLTVPLLAGSPAIDNVPCGPSTLLTGSATIGADQRGVARPQGSACDSGAFEFVPPASESVPPGATAFIAGVTGQRAAALKKCKKKSKAKRRKCKRRANRLPL